MKALVIRGGRLVTPDGVIQGDLAMAEGRIVGFSRDAVTGARVIEADGLLVCPGLIDTHIHGMLEYDTMDATPEALEGIARQLLRHGVTSWMPTTVACTPSELDHVLSVIQSQEESGARILGAHLESSLISPNYRGAQPDALLSPEDPALLEVLDRWSSLIRIVTLAPEREGALPLIRKLSRRGIRISCGHSDASYDEVVAARDAGLGRITHLFNAQRPLHHREPGVVGAGLALSDLYAELVADGIHVHPAAVNIAHRCKQDWLVLVSDALRGTDLAPGTYSLGGQTTILDGQVARLESGAIAGSVTPLDKAVKNLANFAHIPLEKAFQAATLAPARSIGRDDLGILGVGAQADVALFTPELVCRGAIVGGELRYNAI